MHVTFLISNITSFQLYVPLFVIYINKKYQVNLLIRKNVRKPNICPIKNTKEYESILNKYDLNIISVSEWLNNGGITYCVDGDIVSYRYGSYVESYIVSLIQFLKPEKRQKFLIISLVANTDYIWSYSYYINLVDYVIFPHKDYLYSFYSHQLSLFKDYQESIGYHKKYKRELTEYINYLTDSQHCMKDLILDNITNIKSSVKYVSSQALKETLMNHINSNKNLYLGTPKFDFKVDKDIILKKYGIPSNTKIAIIFHPEHKWRSAYKKYSKFPIRIFYTEMHKWLRQLGYHIVIKDRLKDMNLTTGTTAFPRKPTGDTHVYNPDVFPNPSIELLHVANIAVIFSSSVIEELFYTNTTIIDINVDQVDRHNFLRNNQNCYLIDKLPDQETFIKTLKQIEENKETGVYDKYIQNTTQKYYPIQKRPYSNNIFNTIKYLYQNRYNNTEVNKYIETLHQNMDTIYIDNKIKEFDNKIFNKS